ncbi:F-box only protein 2-like [Hyperolius riggenbachi]|uniref:F-box only protein 2-like n=1 Tax=Hyperolius riggenbachi TaxID=752182 RepID=UPI0035A274D2
MCSRMHGRGPFHEVKNLIKNPCAQDNLNAWEEVECAGDGWRTETAPGDCGSPFPHNEVAKYFVTSFGHCSKSQTIDLIHEGYSAENLDHHQPDIVVSDWYGGRSDASSTYELCVQLLSANKSVVSEYKSGQIAIPKTNCGWKQITHTFSHYGPGVRFVHFKHSGQDSVGWKGWYGARVTNSSVIVRG